MDRFISTNGKLYAHYTVQAEALCLGERIRGGVLRPCIDVFTYTGLVGALKARFPHPYRSIHAVGRFRNAHREILIFSPRERGREASVVPLEIECLTGVQADLYVQLNDFTVTWPSSFVFRLGAMKSKGFGQCRARKVGEVKAGEPQIGKLIMRVPDNQDVLDALGIEEVVAPVFGYLFQPERGGTGHYVRALFEGSTVKADPILLAER